MKNINSESNRLKSLAGKELQNFLISKFKLLVENEIIKKVESNKNFNHKNFPYKKQYLANFIIETNDNKFIVINSSNSFRHDRMKNQAYDLDGIKNNAEISDKIIASILLYPDSELENESLIKFRDNVNNKKAFSPASHILVLNELITFIENHTNSVLNKKTSQDEKTKDGRYYAIRGNELEKEIVIELNNTEKLKKFRGGIDFESPFYFVIMNKLCTSNEIQHSEITKILATNTVLKLRSGGNAKTDIIIKITTLDKEIIETISVKNTTKSWVSCHDYKSIDFIRVLGIEGTKLAEYFDLYQAQGSNKHFLDHMLPGDSLSEFESLLTNYKTLLIEWALMGKHDEENLIAPEQQISKYILINKPEGIIFIDYLSYIEIISSTNHLYGLPFSWTYPSKQRGKRIQLKMPIIIQSQQ